MTLIVEAAAAAVAVVGLHHCSMMLRTVAPRLHWLQRQLLVQSFEVLAATKLAVDQVGAVDG